MVSLIPAIIIQQHLPRLTESKTLQHNPAYSRKLLSIALSYPLFVIRDSSILLALRSSSTSCSTSPASSSILQTSTTISRNMANHSLSSSDASLDIRSHRSSGPQSAGFAALVNFGRSSFWVCSHCEHINNGALSPEMCGDCGHRKCIACRDC